MVVLRLSLSSLALLLWSAAPCQAQPASGATHSPKPATTGLGAGFGMVGSVAVLEGDELTSNVNGTGFGLDKENMAEISRRFIAAFGDNYDQIAVFLGFSDRSSPQALAYQQPVKNTIKGIGLGQFDDTLKFGSASGRMESMLNMKRINIYGRDAANDPQNDLYSVWAQEAAHRWALYFKYRFATDAMDRTDLLLRQNAHWAPWVAAEGSFMDGYNWKDNGDGTFTVLDTNKRWGTMDQYAMGLRTAADVPPFFVLDDFKDEMGAPITRPMRFARGTSYKARKIVVTVQDVIRAMGPREPAASPAAEDLRMGVVFLTPPGQGLTPLLGEAFRVDTTRAPWDNFYNEAAGGRGKVCTSLLAPCRGNAFAFGEAKFVVTGNSAAPGTSATLTVPVSNIGTEAGIATVTISGSHPIVFEKTTSSSGSIAPGAVGSVSFAANIPPNVACGVNFKFDFQAPGKLGPSRGSSSISLGLIPSVGSTLEDPSTLTSWKVNPAGTDTAAVGAWEWGTAEKTEAFDFVLQPAGALSGTKAFVTGAAKGEFPESNDLDFDPSGLTVGRTTLQSPLMPLASIVNPRLSYQLYFVSAGFQKEVLIPGLGDSFYVQASLDGGPWVEVDRVPSSLALSWENRVINLQGPLGAALNAASHVQFRFIAEDSNLSETVVEASVDDVFLMGELPGCGTVVSAPDAGVDAPVTTLKSDDGCSCKLGGRRQRQSGFATVGIVAAFLIAKRRRTSRKHA